MVSGSVKSVMETIIEKSYYEGANATYSQKFEAATGNIDNSTLSVISGELKDKYKKFTRVLSSSKI